MITSDNLETVKKLLKTEPSPKIVRAQDELFNRKMLEYGKFDCIVGLEASPAKDTLRQQTSGFNHVLAKIAVKNNVAIGIDLEVLRSLELHQKTIQLGRIRQNIEIARKAKTQLAVLNATGIHAAKGVLFSLGASSLQVKKAIYF